MHYRRALRALAACVMAVGVLVLPAPPSSAQAGPSGSSSATYQVVDAYDAEVYVNGAPAEYGTLYGAEDLIELIPLSPDASVTLAETDGSGNTSFRTLSSDTFIWTDGGTPIGGAFTETFIWTD